MELSFNSGRFVSLDGELNYAEVLADFSHARIIRILTYNISKNQRHDALLNALKGTTADVQLITNVPSRQNRYYPSAAGLRMRSAARDNINIYISKLNPERISENFNPFFNVRNHAKIICTENIVYIGSANYSNESANNIETGVLIEDKEFIQQLYSEFFDKVKRNPFLIMTRFSLHLNCSLCLFAQNLRNTIERCFLNCIQITSVPIMSLLTQYSLILMIYIACIMILNV